MLQAGSHLFNIRSILTCKGKSDIVFTRSRVLSEIGFHFVKARSCRY
jgi:hypothetical protein